MFSYLFISMLYTIYLFSYLFIVYVTFPPMTQLHNVEWYNDWWIMNWIASWRKRSQSKLSDVPTVTWRDWRKPPKYPLSEPRTFRIRGRNIAHSSPPFSVLICNQYLDLYESMNYLSSKRCSFLHRCSFHVWEFFSFFVFYVYFCVSCQCRFIDILIFICA
jgi:hypothetical protein